MANERREDRRIPVEMWVQEHRGTQEVYFQRSANISAGGIYLDGTIPHPRGTIVQLKFTLPGQAEPIEIRGEIVGEPDEKRLGMHVKFVDLDQNPAVRERLREFVDRSGPLQVA